MAKNPLANSGDTRDTGSIPGLGRFPWRRKWHPTPVFLPGESQGQRSLVGHRVRHDRARAHTHARYIIKWYFIV